MSSTSCADEPEPSPLLPSDMEQGDAFSPRDASLMLSVASRDVQFAVLPSSSRRRGRAPNDLDCEISSQPLWVKTISLSVALLAVTCAAVFLNVAIRGGWSGRASAQAYVAGSHAGFANYVSAKVHPSISARPPLCDSDIVLTTCSVLNNETLEAYGSSADTDLSYVHAVEIAEVLSVSKISVLAMLGELRLSNFDAHTPDAYAVSCQELCEKLVASFPQRVVPGMSDVGCYWHPNGFSLSPACDVDLAPHVLSSLRMKDTPVSKKDGHYAETAAMKAVSPDSAATNGIDEALNNAENLTWNETIMIDTLMNRNLTEDQLRTETINLFRIFPALSSKVSEGEGFMGIFSPAEPRLSHRQLDGGSVASEQTDHLERDLASTPDDSCQYAKDGSCDYADGMCVQGTDCTDCRDCTAEGSTSDSCQYSRDSVCDEPPHTPYYCYAGTDCTDCGTCSQRPNAESRRRVASGGITDWKQKTLQVAVKAKAFLNQAVTKMSSRQVPDVVTKWYGNNLDFPTRQEVKRVINGVKAMLQNVDYVYPGDQCKPNVYAYVYQNSPWNKDSSGRFVVHLCDYYMKVDEGEQIETLLHEGSHHQGMQTDDSKWGSSTMYGRQICQQVATKCRLGTEDACTVARKNADTFCYFVYDAASASTGIMPAGRRRLAFGPPRRRRLVPATSAGNTTIPVAPMGSSFGWR